MYTARPAMKPSGVRPPTLLHVLIVLTGVLAALQTAAPNLFAFDTGEQTRVLQQLTSADQVSTEAQVSDTTATSNAFVMTVKIVMGGGYGRLPDGTIGEVRQFNLMGDLIQGALPSPGSQGVLGRKDGTTLAVQIGDSSQLPDGRVSVRVDQVDIPDVNGAYVLASDASLLSAVAAPTPVPGEPTAADDYADYSGPPLQYTAQPVDDVDFEILVRLARTPSLDEASSLERAIRAWDKKGMVDGFGTAMFWGGAGHLHGLKRDSQFGPRWTGESLRWLEDFGTADAKIAADDLARRLAGWSASDGVAIVELNFGQYGTR